MPLDDVGCFFANVATVCFGLFEQTFLDMRRQSVEQDGFGMGT